MPATEKTHTRRHGWRAEVEIETADGAVQQHTYYVLGSCQGRALDVLLEILDDVPGQVRSVLATRFEKGAKA